MTDLDIRGPANHGNRFFDGATRAALEQQLHHWVEAVHAETLGSVSYVDTLRLLNDGEIDPSVEERIDQTTEGGAWVEGRKPWWYRRFLKIQRPTPRTYTTALDLMPGHKINRFDPALDFLTQSRAAAETLQAELQHLLEQTWRGNRITYRFEQTNYLAKGRTNRTIIDYPDKSSKITHGPAFHFEPRYRGTTFCRERGLHNCLDLIDLDLPGFIARDFRLSVLCPKLINKRFTEQAELIRNDGRARGGRGWRSLSAPNLMRLYHLIERDALYEVYGDRDWTSWRDLLELPIQDVLDRVPCLRSAVASIPGNRLIYIYTDHIGGNGKKGSRPAQTLNLSEVETTASSPPEIRPDHDPVNGHAHDHVHDADQMEASSQPRPDESLCHDLEHVHDHVHAADQMKSQLQPRPDESLCHNHDHVHAHNHVHVQRQPGSDFNYSRIRQLQTRRKPLSRPRA